MIRKPRLSMLNRDDMERVHGGVLTILDRTGIRFDCPEAVEVFRSHGARVEEMWCIFQKR